MRKRYVVAAYLALLFVSHLLRTNHQEAPLSPQSHAVQVQAFDGDQPLGKIVRLAYREFPEDSSTTGSAQINTPSSANNNSQAAPPTNNEAQGNATHLPKDGRPVVVLLHGSPGNAKDFNSLAPALAKNYRVIRPDLPGFGESTRQVPDYSIRAHAHYVLALLDNLRIERAHIVGFSMGGGVALQIAELAPERTASLTMLSATGVQEMELLGDYHLNHFLHGLQLAGLWLLREATPHFGLFDNTVLGVEYARNFYDSDQRPLREILNRIDMPMLILHGRRDSLVPVEAAIEHHRLVPQSQLEVFEQENHFTVFSQGDMLSQLMVPFLDQVEHNRATRRSNAEAARLTSAAEPFDLANIPRARGVTTLVFILLIAAATLVSEDLTCIGAGVMVAQGRIDFAAAAFACFLGIYVGDILLFFAGRFLGRPALHRAPLKWFLKAEEVEKSSAWFSRNGMAVIAASRFLPGARLPTYFAAGVLRTEFWRFALYFFLAAAVWTPILVGLSSVLGAEVLQSAFLAKQNLLIKLLAAGLCLYVFVKLLIALSTYRGRRMLVSWWRRKARWEFWPMWAFYPPVVFYVIYLMMRHRSLTLFTASNPAIPSGGFVGESKADILRGLASAEGFIARSAFIRALSGDDEKFEQAKNFMLEQGYDFPVVLKPDLGERGSSVAVARSEEEMREYLKQAKGDTVIQEYITGYEFGVFYYRYPESQRGQIFAITEKRFPVVTGDGASTLERLILQDERAVCMAKFYLEKQRENLWDVPGESEQRQLVELGTHCRGAIFLDGGWVKTDELEEAIDRLSKIFEGFYFGRYDIRTPSLEDFKRGKNFKVIELNGVTSEATNIYDPKNSLFAAYRVLFQQWRIAFEIGAQNRKRGVKPMSVRELIKLVIEFRKRAAQ
jgi:pimeloyl-ACP methyl ester carboxylesterase/membrane protein DedA with SNARE-associated domain